MLSNKKRRIPKDSQITNVTLLLDMSGSMNVRRYETIREVNRYLDKLRSDGQPYRLTVTTFNEYTNNLLYSKNIADVGELEPAEYHPNGWTRLLDAVGEALSSGHYSDSNERHLFCVVTDGQENDSRHYSLSQVRNLIDQKRFGDYYGDFQFVFLGAGPDSWTVGRNLGFNISVSTDWSNPRNSENIYKSLYTASNAMSQGGPIGAQMFNTNSTSATNTTPAQNKNDD